MAYRYLIAASIAAAALGCGETGVLIEVSRAEGGDSEIVELRFYAGVAEGNDEDDPSALFIGERVDIVALDGRNLSEDPYTYFLKRGSGDRVVVGVEGVRGDGGVESAQLSRPVSFRSGRVLKFEMLLSPGSLSKTAAGCIQTGGVVLSESPQDLDCDGVNNDVDCSPNNTACVIECIDDPDLDGDGFTAGGVWIDGCAVDEVRYADCKPEDRFSHPLAFEGCGVRDDCNGTTQRESEACFTSIMDSCVAGLRQCGSDACSPVPLDAAQVAIIDSEPCQEFTRCEEEHPQDPAGCAAERSGIALECALAFNVHAPGEGCETLPQLLPTVEAASCNWFAAGSTAQTYYSYEFPGNGSCSAAGLSIAPLSAPPKPSGTFIVADTGAGSGALFYLKVTPEPKAECPAPEDALRCEGLSSAVFASQ